MEALDDLVSRRLSVGKYAAKSGLVAVIAQGGGGTPGHFCDKLVSPGDLSIRHMVAAETVTSLATLASVWEILPVVTNSTDSALVGRGFPQQTHVEKQPQLHRDRTLRHCTTDVRSVTRYLKKELMPLIWVGQHPLLIHFLTI
jgi:hypothetical protein